MNIQSSFAHPHAQSCYLHVLLLSVEQTDDILKKVDVQTTVAPTDKLDNIAFDYELVSELQLCVLTAAPSESR